MERDADYRKHSANMPQQRTLDAFTVTMTQCLAIQALTPYFEINLLLQMWSSEESNTVNFISFPAQSDLRPLYGELLRD
jgi:hypothetical protein